MKRAASEATQGDSIRDDSNSESKDERDGDRKRAAARASPPNEEEEIPTEEVTAADLSRMSRSERKRHREKKRRIDVNKGFDDLMNLLLEIDPEVRAEVENRARRGQWKGSPSAQEDNLLSRVELINRTVEVLGRVHKENEERKVLIEQLLRGTALSSAPNAGMAPLLGAQQLQLPGQLAAASHPMPAAPAARPPQPLLPGSLILTSGQAQDAIRTRLAPPAVVPTVVGAPVVGDPLLRNFILQQSAAPSSLAGVATANLPANVLSNNSLLRQQINSQGGRLSANQALLANQQSSNPPSVPPSEAELIEQLLRRSRESGGGDSGHGAQGGGANGPT